MPIASANCFERSFRSASNKSKFTFNSWNFAPPLKNQIKVIEFIDKLRPYFKLINKNIIIKKTNFFYESERLT